MDGGSADNHGRWVYKSFLIGFISTEWTHSALAAAKLAESLPSPPSRFTVSPQAHRPSGCWLSSVSSGNQRMLNWIDPHLVAWCYYCILLLCHLNSVVHPVSHSDLLKSLNLGVSQMASVLETSSHSSNIFLPLSQGLGGDTQIYVYFSLFKKNLF